MCSDSDLGPVTLQVRDLTPPLQLPQLGSPPGPAPARCRPDFIKTLTSHVPPRGHVTLTHDTLAANTQKIVKINGSKLCT
jgi:hypothetical protein